SRTGAESPSHRLAVCPRRQVPAGTATVPVPVRSARRPASTGRCVTPDRPGPTYRPVHSSGAPPERTETLVSLTGTAAPTPGAARTAATVTPASPAELPPGVIMTGALIRVRAADCWVAISVSVPAMSEPAIPTVTRTGAAVAAVRRTAVMALRRASIPVAPAA